MECEDEIRQCCEWKFVESFVAKDRQERYFEMLCKKDFKKFRWELDMRIWKFLNPKTTLLCKKGIFIKSIMEMHPKLFTMDTCYVTDYSDDHDGRTLRIAEYIEHIHTHGVIAFVCTFIPGKLAIYYSELVGVPALCYRLEGLDGPLAVHPMFRDIVDRARYNLR